MAEASKIKPTGTVCNMARYMLDTNMLIYLMETGWRRLLSVLPRVEPPLNHGHSSSGGRLVLLRRGITFYFTCFTYFTYVDSIESESAMKS